MMFTDVVSEARETGTIDSGGGACTQLDEASCSANSLVVREGLLWGWAVIRVFAIGLVLRKALSLVNAKASSSSDSLVVGEDFLGCWAVWWILLFSLGKSSSGSDFFVIREDLLRIRAVAGVTRFFLSEAGSSWHIIIVTESLLRCMLLVWSIIVITLNEASAWWHKVMVAKSLLRRMLLVVGVLVRASKVDGRDASEQKGNSNSEFHFFIKL